MSAQRGPEPVVQTAAPAADHSPAWARLENQIGWYDAKSGFNQRWFKILKTAQIALAAFVPVLAATDAPAWSVGTMGALIVILEALQQLFQFQQNWITYRSTCEALKHERYLFESSAGPYGAATRPQALLAERVEGLVSQEHARWVSAREEVAHRTTDEGAKRESR